MTFMTNVLVIYWCIKAMLKLSGFEKQQWFYFTCQSTVWLGLGHLGLSLLMWSQPRQLNSGGSTFIDMAGIGASC
jgi:hypothetical protein